MNNQVGEDHRLGPFAPLAFTRQWYVVLTGRLTRGVKVETAPTELRVGKPAVKHGGRAEIAP